METKTENKIQTNISIMGLTIFKLCVMKKGYELWNNQIQTTPKFRAVVFRHMKFLT